MNNLPSILFFNLLVVLFVPISNDPHKDKYLPLVMIQHEGSLWYPNELREAKLSEDQDGKFLFDVRFDWSNIHHNQIFFCPSNSPQQKEQIHTANQLLEKSEQLRKHFRITSIGEQCLFENEFEVGKPVQCTVEAIPILRKVEAETSDGIKGIEKRCGPNNRGTQFRFYYDICPSMNPLKRVWSFLRYVVYSHIRSFAWNVPFDYHPLKIYDICYDMAAKRTIYTKHELSVIKLLRNKKLQHEIEKEYPLGTFNYGYFGDNFNDDIQFYSLLSNQNNESSDSENISKENTEGIFKPHQLVPSKDMMSAILGKPAFHYINVQPMHETMIELWTHIEEIIRKNLDDSVIPFEIYTGAFNISKESKKSRIPDMWIKIIRIKVPSYAKKKDLSLMIAMKNGNGNNGNELWEQFCEQDYCKSFKNNVKSREKFNDRIENVRCCPVDESVEDLFGFSNKNEPIFRILNLVDFDEQTQQNP